MSAANDTTHGPGATTLAVRAEGGQVLLVFPNPVVWCQLEPQVAYQAGEAIARAAHEARFGEAPKDGHYIAGQVRARVTEDLRERMVTRVGVMLNSIGNRPPATQARMIVDTILAEVA